MLPTKHALREIVRTHVREIVSKLNEALRGEELGRLREVLTRVGRGGRIPHWYEDLERKHVLPNLDGKTVGSVVEMILVGVLEEFFFVGKGVPPLRINPARGVDIPDLDLGVKSPSENFCTSEPFFSAYERLYGSEHDVLVLLTNYQDAKRQPPLRLQISDARYLTGSQVADRRLCAIARKHRNWLVAENEARAKRFFRFLAFVNQSDWRARKLLRLLDSMNDEGLIEREITETQVDFDRTNERLERRGTLPLASSELDALLEISEVRPKYVGVIDAADNWAVEVLKEAAHAPNDNEWGQLVRSPLDGMIGISFALQWRYNFGTLFGEAETNAAD